ncbi:MAG: restriction endonuclease [Candidatus Pacebacteria bacterium]|nr:restriction endonuclease [Candidatus Paceibacterota bacterium]MCF7862715.1 restriction endonuclease [Candidatus Paceibacterota bacterium]
MAKPKITRTYGPIHFEDLDPKRFEDLARELIYDFKDWQTIEATGRGGNDGGFDVRAYEKTSDISNEEDSEENEEKVAHPMDGNLWMIQGKREKEIGPKRIKEILKDVDSKNPPYGYMLVASANFSKDSYDSFRKELKKKGVMEFYLWGKAELEDMLHLPKNDRILFTFFGISLVSRRRSKSAEVRSKLVIKNKIYKTLGGSWESLNDTSVLVRDIDDIHYPYKNKYKDFDKKPKWKEYFAYDYHPLGVWFHTRKYYAYVDLAKKEWDYTSEVDLLYRQVKSEKEKELELNKRNEIKTIWEFFPNSHKGYFNLDGLIDFENILLVDDKGDSLHTFPHFYAEYKDKSGPFVGGWESFTFENKERNITLTKDWKRIEMFPKKIKKIPNGKIHTKKKIIFDEVTLKNLKDYDQNLFALYDTDDKYKFLNQRDIISVEGAGDEEYSKTFLQITHKFKVKVKDYLDQSRFGWLHNRIKEQLGRDFDENEEINVYEFKRVYKREFDVSG